MLKSRVFYALGVFVAFVLGLLTYHPLAKAVESLGVMTCKATVACTGGNNTSSGAGVTAVSAGGNGALGQTKFNSTSVSNFRSGLFGQDASKKGAFDLGVFGLSKRGDGVFGQSTSGSGVAGSSSSSIAINGLTLTGAAGVYGQTNGGTAPTGVWGYDNSTAGAGYGVYGQSNAGTGVVAQTSSSSSATEQAILAEAGNGADIFAGYGQGAASSSNRPFVIMDLNGNLAVSGQISGSQSVCAKGCGGNRSVRTFAAMQTTASLEDTGEAQLTGGGAYVHLDPAFANVIDARLGYYVLITPEGDTHGLYVAARTPAGFAVRESFGGRSNATFAYRIVARPLGAADQRRLPFVTNRAAPASNRHQPAAVRLPVEPAQ